MTAGSKLVTATIKKIWQETPTVNVIQLAVVSLHGMVQTGARRPVGLGAGGAPCLHRPHPSHSDNNAAR
jgi:hypothetical protein